MKPNSFARPTVARINPSSGAPARLSEAFGGGEHDKETSAAPTEGVFNFQIQSEIDGTLVYQPPGNLIVPTTAKEGQTSGYSALWSPDSECPAAVVFSASRSGQQISSKPIIVLPGQLVRPHGLTKDLGRGDFGAYTVGLPYGWLGGGIGRMLILKTPDSKILQASAQPREVMFHATQLTIAASFTTIPNWAQNPFTKTAGGTGGGDNTHASQNWNAVPWNLAGTPQWFGAQGVPVPNWPNRFPWPNAYGSDSGSGLSKLAMGPTPSGQPGGSPRMSVRPTRVVFSLQTQGQPSGGGSTGSVNAYVVPPSILAQPATGILRKYPQVQYVTFPAGDANGYSTFEVTDGPLVSMAGDDAAVGLTSGDASLQGLTVSVFRYGVLG